MLVVTFPLLVALLLQKALKGSVSSTMTTVLRSYTDVCDALFVLEIGLRFLGKTGGDPQAQLLSYLTDSLHMRPQISSTVAKVWALKANETKVGVIYILLPVGL